MKGIQVLALALLLSGCARYEYLLVEPSQFARGITKDKTRFEDDPMEYELFERSGRLAMAVINPGAEPISVVPSKSYIVAPDGESHPLQGVSIAPNSYTAMLLPPEPPVYWSSPSFSFGFGVGSYYGPYFSSGYHLYHDPFYYDPPRTYYPMNLPHYWRWKTGQVRLRLAYERGTNAPFTHDFVFERRKVE